MYISHFEVKQAKQNKFQVKQSKMKQKCAAKWNKVEAKQSKTSKKGKQMNEKHAKFFDTDQFFALFHFEAKYFVCETGAP